MVMKVYKNKPSIRMTLSMEIQNSDDQSTGLLHTLTNLAVNPSTEAVGQDEQHKSGGDCDCRVEIRSPVLDDDVQRFRQRSRGDGNVLGGSYR